IWIEPAASDQVWQINSALFATQTNWSNLTGSDFVVEYAKRSIQLIEEISQLIHNPITTTFYLFLSVWTGNALATALASYPKKDLKNKPNNQYTFKITKAIVAVPANLFT